MTGKNQKNTDNVPLLKRLPAIILSALTLVGGVVFFFLPIADLRFWTFDYILFLAFILGVPAFLSPRKGRFARGFLILFALAYFGFLQAACPRLPGAIELIILNSFKEQIEGRPHWLDYTLMHFIKVGAIVGMGMLFGRYYCGWICPKGIIQEYIYRPYLKFNIPNKADRILKIGKYIMLLALLIVPIFYRAEFLQEIWPLRVLEEGRLFYKIGPFRAIFNLDASTYVLIFLVIVLLSSLCIERAYCRYFCPEGGLLALLQMISPFKMRLQEHSCKNCGRCIKACPVNAFTTDNSFPLQLSQTECIACKECEAQCRNNGIYYGMKHRNIIKDQYKENQPSNKSIEK